ncbi:hypothetical protein HPP92_027038 [Vanilla planifolia]|uniref:Uncharacterized protein n=1 Tax=Vanilla planifolia TaxID=51239 RepID=A0A835PDY3_VANPL|nr:hypothetical protein HPP92_027156 [Vanilla planifolia]KAG0449912.1 hypothetical protein HPP92_027038 [Vanilla planifolia]
MASLVQAASRPGARWTTEPTWNQACASGWWEFFLLPVEGRTVDDADLSIFGAIYEFNSPVSIRTTAAEHAPKVVIAFEAPSGRRKPCQGI